MINILVWIVFGMVAGVIAKMIMPGKDPGGWIITILLGIAGSSVGGFIGRELFNLNVGGNSFSLANMATSVVGALLLLAAYRFFSKKKGA